MAGKSQAQSDACLALIATAYVGLLTATPDASDDFVAHPVTECSGGGYARQSITWGTKTTDADTHTRDMSNTNTITFGPATGADWPSVTYFGIYAAVSGGAPLYVGQLTVPKTVQVGDSAQYAAGALTVKED